VILKDLLLRIEGYKSQNRLPSVRINMAKTKVLETLPEDKQNALKQFVDYIRYNELFLKEPEVVDEEKHQEYLDKVSQGLDPDETTDEGVIQRTNLEMLMALLECLDVVKKEAKEFDKEYEKFDIEKAKSDAIVNGERYKEQLAAGDIVTFTMGTKVKKNYTRVVLKCTDKSFHVAFDEEYPCDVSSQQIGNKHVKYSAIVSIQKPNPNTAERSAA
jgi:hypothetical protein